MNKDKVIDIPKLQERIRKHKACRGYGYVLKDGALAECSCRVSALFEYRLVRSHIPDRYRKLGFNDFMHKDSAAYRGVQSYLADSEKHRREGIGLFIWGDSHTGKSLLATSLLMELLRKGNNCRFEYFGGLMTIRDKEIYTAPDFLCIDDFGIGLNGLSNFRDGVLTGERVNGGVEFLTQIVAHRVNSGSPVIVVSEVPIATINNVFPHLASPLIGNCIQLHCEDKGFKTKRINQMMEGG